MGCGAGKTPATTSDSPESPRKQYDEKSLQSFVAGIPIFAKLPNADLAKLVQAFERRNFSLGDVVVKQGDVGSELFIIAEGEAAVKISKAGSECMTVAILQKGDFFGENALLRPDQMRNATISSQGDLTCYALSKCNFDRLGLREKILFPKRKAIPCSAGDRSKGARASVKDKGKKMTHKTPLTMGILAKALKSNDNLKAMLGELEDGQVKAAVERAWRKEVRKGEELIVQGDEEADSFYLVEKGRFEVWVRADDHADIDKMAGACAQVSPTGFTEDIIRKSCARASVARGTKTGTTSAMPTASMNLLPGMLTEESAVEGEPIEVTASQVMTGSVHPIMRTLVAEKGPGSSFGELALIHSACRAATISAADEATVWVIDRSDFKGSLIEYAETQADKYCGLLETVDLIQKLSPEERRAVSQECVEEHFNDNDCIIREGEDGNCFYIIEHGTCDCYVGDEKVKQMMRGEFFGEKALLHKEPRKATVKVAPDYGGADLLKLDQESFEETLGPKAFDRVKHLFLKAVASTIVTQKTDGEHKQIEGFAPSHLKKIGNLGLGGFGPTTLEKDKRTEKYYAIKQASKTLLQQRYAHDTALNEKKLLHKCKSNFVVECFGSFRDTDNLYYILEPCLGGDLYTCYQKHGLYGNLPVTKFYTGCVCLALQSIHTLQVIHRDIKSENVLIDSMGYGKICNFGLAKLTIGRTYTFCGTPEYLAPEVVSLKAGYGRAADWWALGILLFEMMSGSTPFVASDPMQIYKNIKAGQTSIKWPPSMPYGVKELIVGLLQEEPRERMGMKGKIDALKKQQWVGDLNWQDLEKRSMTPPYVPKLANAEDLSGIGEVDVSDFTKATTKGKDVTFEWDDEFGPTTEEMELLCSNKQDDVKAEDL